MTIDQAEVGRLVAWYAAGDRDTLRYLRRRYQATSRLDAVLEGLLAQLVHARCHAQLATTFGDDDGHTEPVSR